MATQDVRLRLTADGSQATRELDRVKRGLGSVAQAAAAAFGLAAGGSLIASFARIADSAANNAAKIKLATSSAQEYAAAQEEVFRIAQKTSTSLDATTSLYAKLSASLRAAGEDTSKVALLTETVNKALLVSGASAQSSAAAVLQLGQAFASGRLSGDEFRSVAENAPRILTALQNSLGKTAGELRAMAKAQLLTTDVLLKGLTGAEAQKIAAEAAQIPVTIARGFTQVQNALQQFVGQADQANGVSRSLGEGLVFVAKNMEPIAQAGGALLAGGLLLFLARAAGGLALYTKELILSAAAQSATIETNILSSQAQITSASVTIAATNATKSQAVVNLASAESALAAASATRAQAQVNAFLATGTAAAAQATAALTLAVSIENAAMAAATVTTAELAAAENAATAAAARLTAANEALALANAQLAASQRAAGASMLAFVGGPIGVFIIAIAAATFAVVKFRSESENNLSAALEGIDREIQANKDLIASLNEAQRVREGASSSIKSNVDIAKESLVSIQEQIESYKLLQAATAGIIPGIDLAGVRLNYLQAQANEASAKLDELTETNKQAALAQERAAQAARLQAAELSAVTLPAGAFGDAMRLIVAGVETFSGSSGLAAAAANKLASAFVTMKGAINGILGSSAQLTEQLSKQTIELRKQAFETRGGDFLVAATKLQILFKGAVGGSTEALKFQLAQYQLAKTDASAATAAQKGQAAATKAFAAETRSAAEAMEDLRQLTDDLNQSFAGPGAAALEQYNDRLARIAEARKDLSKGGISAAEQTQLIEAETAAAYALSVALTEVYDAQFKLNAENIKATQAAEDYIPNLEREYALLKLSAEQRAIVTAGLEAEKGQRDALNATSGQYTADEINRIAAQAGARAQALERDQQVFDLAREAAEEYENKWGQAIGGVADAFGDFVTGGIKSFKDFGSALKQIAQRFMADLISQFARKIILNLSVNGSASGGGGLLGTASSLLGGQGGGLLGSIGNVVGGIGRGISGLIGGIGTGAAVAASAGAFAGAAAGAAGAGAVGAGVGAAGAGAFAGAGATATAGLAAIPVVGWIALAALAAYSIFKKEAPPDLRLGAVGRTRKPEETFQTELGTLQIGVRGGTNSDEFKKLVTDFDQGLSQIVGSFANGQDQLDAVKARLATWSIDLKGSAVTVEAALGSRFSAILSTFSQDIQAFVGSTGTVAERVARLQDAAFIDAAARSGELLSSFTDLAGVLTGARIEGEALNATYARVAGATALLDDATALMGVTFEGTRVEFITAAAEIAEAAGGLDRATSLWQTYFDNFYTDNERAAQTLAASQAARDSALTALGLATNISAAAYRAEFERLAPTLTPAQIVQWLEGAAAIAAADQAQERYNGTLGEAETAINSASNALGDAVNSLADINSQLDRDFQDLARAGLNDFQRQLLEIDDGLRANVSALQAQRAAAENAGASSEVLAQFDRALGRAHLLAAQQAAAAINALRGAGRSLVAQLYGQVTSAAQSVSDAGTSAINDIGEAQSNLYASQLAAIKGIQDYLDSQLLGNLSALTPQERLDEAQSQFDAALALAQTGDVGALQDVTRLADILLRERQSRFGGQGFREFQDAIRASLTGLLGVAGGTRPFEGNGNGGGNFGGALNQTASEFGEQATTNRLELAQQLSDIVANLLQATGDSLSEVAASIGLNISSLVTDLGVNLNALTGASTASLGQIANSLGIELSELAQNLGVDLGALSTDQSLINAALESEIAKLPADQAARLQPLLDDVERAAATGGPDKVNAAIAVLTNAAQEIGGDAAFKLAPYLDDIDPTNPLNNIDTALRSGLRDANATLDDILSTLLLGPTAGPTGPGLPTNPIGGGGGLPGSIVTGQGAPPAPAVAAALRQAEANNAALLAELKRVNARLASLEQTVKAGDKSNVQATTGGAQIQAAAIDRQTLQTKGGKLVMSRSEFA